MYRRNIAVFISVILLVKMALVFWLPLGIDESYYLLYARYFDWHYYDHPFLIGAVLKIFTKSMQLRHPFLPPPFCIGFSSINFIGLQAWFLSPQQKSRMVCNTVVYCFTIHVNNRWLFRDA